MALQRRIIVLDGDDDEDDEFGQLEQGFPAWTLAFE